MNLSLVIPVYNEASRINRGLRTALDYLNRQKYSWEIIIVDDGSTDGSTRDILNLESKILNLKFLRTSKNFGKGHAIRLGVEVSTGQYIIFSDIDFSVPVEFTSSFLTQLKSADIVIGSRRLPKSSIARHQNIFRESLGQGFTALSNLILGLNHTDLTCGFKGFRQGVAKDIFSRQRLNHWAFDSEILFLAKKNYKVVEVPVTWYNDPHTKVNLIKDTLVSLISLVSIRLYHL